jgi:protein-tyrosine phosphatase
MNAHGILVDTMRVLFVCLGNICRSPLAEGIFRQAVENAGLAERITIDSAGTGNWHVGEPPDPRAQACGRKFGVDIGELRGRQFAPADFQEFDHILVMDSKNRRDVLRLAQTDEHKAKVRMLLEHGPVRTDSDVPDPYFGGDQGFDDVFDMLSAACDALLESIRQELKS